MLFLQTPTNEEYSGSRNSSRSGTIATPEGPLNATRILDSSQEQLTTSTQSYPTTSHSYPTTTASDSKQVLTTSKKSENKPGPSVPDVSQGAIKKTTLGKKTTDPTKIKRKKSVTLQDTPSVSTNSRAQAADSAQRPSLTSDRTSFESTEGAPSSGPVCNNQNCRNCEKKKEISFLGFSSSDSDSDRDQRRYRELLHEHKEFERKKRKLKPKASENSRNKDVLLHDLSRSIPINSQNPNQSYPHRHGYINVQFSFEDPEDKSLGQESAPVSHENPPSPAPPSPVNVKSTKRREFENTDPRTFEDFEYISNPSIRDPGPRMVVLKIPDNVTSNKTYQIAENEINIDSWPLFGSTLYGCEVVADHHHQYLGCRLGLPQYFWQKLNFSEEILEQYLTREENKRLAYLQRVQTEKDSYPVQAGFCKHDIVHGQVGSSRGDHQAPQPSTSAQAINTARATQAAVAAQTCREEEDETTMNPTEEQERKITLEFCHLLEKSKQLFNGLRELPQYGHKQWSLYFGRTFDIYTRLWKYQQQHRAILDSKYGMKRWQIGEIASKIGQLYYHFYIRTSELSYLKEAFSFYFAIRGRCYYTQANKEDKCELMVKKLRFYARFIVVSLLLRKINLVRDLVKELDRLIIDYANTYDPDDQVEWALVVDEAKAFIHAEPVVAVVYPESHSGSMVHSPHYRLTPQTTPPVERTSQMNLSLQEILIVGSSAHQVKFSELTMDMFRMMQTLERQPPPELLRDLDESPRPRYSSAQNAQSQEGADIAPVPPNPHKYLLYRPTLTQMLVYLASGCNDLPPNGVMLVYISADGLFPPTTRHAEDVPGYEEGGVSTGSRNDIYRDCMKEPKPPPPKCKPVQCLYPGDLYSFTRKPLFLVVDSDNSYAFQNIPRHFGQPMVVLMSPLELPASFHDRRQQGSMFTLFLHSPLSGFCYCCDTDSIAISHWNRGHSHIETFMAEASAILVRSRVDLSFIAFMGDEFLRMLLLRYLFCELVLRMHRGFRARTQLTRSSPSLPEDIFEHPTLVHIVLDLANDLQVRSHFHDPTATMPPSKKD